MKPLPLLLAVLLFMAASAAAASDFTFDSAAGHGPLQLTPQGFALLHTTASVDWTLTATSMRIKVVDDREDNAIPDPANPDDSLVSVFNRTTTYHDFAAATLHWVSLSNPVSIIQGPGILAENVSGQLALTTVSPSSIEQSHYVMATPVGAPELQYDVLVPASLRVKATAVADILGNVTLYSWSNDIQVRHSGGAFELRTGKYTDMPVTQGSLRSRHYVHAFLELRTARANLAIPAAAFYAEGLQVESHGILQFSNLTGELPGPTGLATATGGIVTASAGTFALSPTGTGIGGTVLIAPEAVAGTTARLPGTALPGGVWLALSGMLFVGVVAAPSVHGRRVRQREAATWLGFRDDRATAYSNWAARADNQGWNHAAALLFWRATRNSPTSPELRCEYGVLLRQSGRPKRALRQHVLVGEVLARSFDPGCGALNAYSASLCCAALGKDGAALEWLQAAIEADPGFTETALKEPRLRRLRAHPDYPAIVGAIA